MAKKKVGFEKAIGRLEEIVDRLESGEVSLEETVKLFEEGKRLGQDCRRQLVEWEKKIEMIVEKDNGEIETTDFGNDPEDGSA